MHLIIILTSTDRSLRHKILDDVLCQSVELNEKKTSTSPLTNTPLPTSTPYNRTEKIRVCPFKMFKRRFCDLILSFDPFCT